jgi:hypothetical protein
MNAPALVLNITKSLICLLLFFLAINGVLEKCVSPVLRMDHVIEEDQKFLKTSLKSSLKHFVVFSAAVGGLAAIKDSEIFGIAIGKIVTPFYITVKFLWQIFAFSLIFITIQIGLLKFFQLVSLKIFISAGLIIYSVSLGYIEILKRIGVTLIIIGCVSYALIPYSIYTGKILFEKNSEVANLRLEADLNDFKKIVDDIDLLSFKNLWPGKFKDEVRKTKDSLSKGLDVVLISLSKYFINILIMLFITPLFFYGIIYFVIIQAVKRI